MCEFNYDTADSEFINRIKAGDKKAFGELYRLYFPRLCDFVYQYVELSAVSEELVQDVFLNVWRQRHTLEPKGTLRSYLFKAVRNNALDYLKHLNVEKKYLRKYKNERELEWESQKEKHARLIIQEISSSLSNRQELSDVIEEAIHQLPDRQKIIFLLSREDGLTYLEIADVLDISVKTVETQMGRSLKTLRNLLSDYLPGMILLSGCVAKFF